MSSVSTARPLATAPAAAPSHHAFGATDLGLVLMAVIWGVNYSVVKAGLRSIAPLTFTGIRLMVATVVLFAVAFVVVRDVPWPSRRDIGRLALLGLLGNGVYQLLFIFGLSRTRAGVAALIVAAGPAWIAIISQLMGRERLPSLGWAGIGLQLVGVGCVVGSTQGFDGGGSVMLGAALIAGGSIAWGLFSVLLQPYTQVAHPMHLSAITMASGAGVLALMASPDLVQLDWGALTLGQWGAIGYSSIGALVIAYLLFYRGVRVLGPTRTSVYGNLQPVIALAVAWVVLHETPTGWQLIGAAFIMGGLLLSRLVRPAPVATPVATTDAASGVRS